MSFLFKNSFFQKRVSKIHFIVLSWLFYQEERLQKGKTAWLVPIFFFFSFNESPKK